MQRSTDRILTTHTGSLPRPAALTEALARLDCGETDVAEVDGLVRDAVAQLVRQQADAGVTVVNDGEATKVSYATYVVQRLSGFGGKGHMIMIGDVKDYPAWGKRFMGDIEGLMSMPACDGEVTYADRGPVDADIAALKAAVADVPVRDAFISAASPGVISLFHENHHYPSHEAYLAALADAMKTE